MRSHGERGAATIEVALFTPVIVLILLTAVVGGRLVEARGDVHAAARDAARDASIQPTPETATRAAADTARRRLADRRKACVADDVRVDVAQFRPGGTVAVEVACQVRLADLGLPGMPGEREIRTRFVAPVDPLAVR